MKRFLASILVLSVLSVGLVGLAGCGDKAKTKKDATPAAGKDDKKAETPAAPAK